MPSPPAHLPLLHLCSLALILASWPRSQYKILRDLKLPNLMDIFFSSYLTDPFCCIWHYLWLPDSCSSLLPWPNSRDISDYSFPSFSFISSTFPLSVDIPVGSVLGPCSSHLAHSSWLISSILSLLLSLFLQPRTLLKYSVSCQASLSGLPVGNSVYSKLN